MHTEFGGRDDTRGSNINDIIIASTIISVVTFNVNRFRSSTSPLLLGASKKNSNQALELQYKCSQV